MSEDSGLVCPSCGYNLTALTSSVCPECGCHFFIIQLPGNMRSSERAWFTVGLRILGVWLLVSACDELRTLLHVLFGVFQPLKTPLATYILIVIQHTIIGLYLLLGAQQLVGFVATWISPRHRPRDKHAAG